MTDKLETEEQLQKALEAVDKEDSDQEEPANVEQAADVETGNNKWLLAEPYPLQLKGIFCCRFREVHQLWEKI